MKFVALLAALLCSGCYLSHELDARVADSGPWADARPPRRDSDTPPGDSRIAPPDSDAPPRDADPPVDTGPSCVLPVEAYPRSDVCRPETGRCIEGCFDEQICIVNCLNRDPTCRTCAVRNALTCFNETPCAPLFPDLSCCVVESCGLMSVDEILDPCTLFACMPEVQAYTDCAIRDARRRCRRRVADCGIPPNLLGLD